MSHAVRLSAWARSVRTQYVLALCGMLLLMASPCFKGRHILLCRFGFESLPYIPWDTIPSWNSPPPLPPPTAPFPPSPPVPPAVPAPPGSPPYTSDLDRLMTDLLIWDYVIDGFFWADLFSNFRVAYIDHTATMVREGGQIARHYLATWFVIDLLACVPFDQIVMAAVTNLNASSANAIMLLRTIRLLRLARLLRVLERMKKGGTVRMLKLLFFITLVVHWMACLWFLLYRMLRGSVEFWSFDIQLPVNTTMPTYFLQT